MAERTDPHHTYQPEVIPARLPLVLARGVAGLVMLVLIALIFLFPVSLSVPIARPTQPLPPEPRLQVTPKDDLVRLRAGEDATLGSYGWVDRSRGIVHIPIDEAMRRTAEQGIAGWPAR